ncbi:MAG: methyltransferase domain-containing protein [Thermoplasmata archaeon]|nr:methyltransferase domain-containing protein [Thermoplasmata archaeon]
MIPDKERYAIRGGKEGYERLLLLARERWPETRALFQRAGLRPGMRCLDVGCGGGEVSLEMARLVSPGGSVTGLDMDEVKLGLARQAAVERKLSNVEFRTVNANEWNEPNGYDAVYARFLLHHLRKPVDLLRRMWAGVRPGGVLVVEDADFDGWCWDPPNDGFEFFLRTYRQVLLRSGGDHALGRKLFRYALEAGIPDPQLTVVQPQYTTVGGGKTLPWTTLEAVSEAILSEGLATPAELASALASLAQFLNDPHTLTSGPRIFQLWSKREATRA